MSRINTKIIKVSIHSSREREEKAYGRFLMDSISGFQSTPLANERRKPATLIALSIPVGFNPLLSRTRGESSN